MVLDNIPLDIQFYELTCVPKNINEITPSFSLHTRLPLHLFDHLETDQETLYPVPVARKCTLNNQALTCMT